jgi:hypothetical protein
MADAPFWTTKPRSVLAYTLKSNAFDPSPSDAACSMDQLERVVGGHPKVAVAPKDGDIEPLGAPRPYTQPPQPPVSPHRVDSVVNQHVKTVELVKRNGVYELHEDGMLLEASPKTRDQQLMTEGDFESYNAQFNGGPGEPSALRAMRSVFEKAKGGSLDGSINYTIGRARIFDTGTSEPRLSPLLLRVRLEEGELPPSACKLRIRTVVVQGFDPVTKMNSVADYRIDEAGDVPVSSVLDISTDGVLLPYPATSTAPLHTTLVSKRRTRDAIDSIARTYKRKSDDMERYSDRPSKLLLPSSKDPIIRVFDRLGVVTRDAANATRDSIASGLIWANMQRRFQYARSNIAYDYFSYGDAKVSVFADLAGDLDAIANAILEQEAKESKENSNLAVLLASVFGVDATDQSEKRDIYDIITNRQRELMEYIIGVAGHRNRPLRTDSDREVKNPGTVLSELRHEEELNTFDASGMRKEIQMSHRVDTYLDIEVWDPQYSDVVYITIAPGLQAALEAGRIVQAGGNDLNHDFNLMVGSINRLSGLDKEPEEGRSALFESMLPWGVYNPIYTNDKSPDTQPNFRLERLLANRLRNLLGLPPVPLNPQPAEDKEGWDKIDAKKWPQNILEIGPGDWYRLPFFRPNTIMQSELLEGPTDRWKFVNYLPEEYSTEPLGGEYVARLLPQIVVPRRTKISTAFETELVSAHATTPGTKNLLFNTISSAQHVRRTLNGQVDVVADDERTAASDRLRFYTVYDISKTIHDGSTLTDEMKNVYSATEIMYADSSISTLPFSATYPDSVGANLHAAFYASGEELTEALFTTTGVYGGTAHHTVAVVDATEAFASIVADVLGPTAIDSFTMSDLTSSIRRRVRTRAVAASSLIEKVFAHKGSAIVGANDPILWLAPGSAVALLALQHSSFWNSQWQASNDYQLRGLWTRHVLAFAKALKEIATSKIELTSLPYTNVQSNWISNRSMHPKYDRVVPSIVFQVYKSVKRAKGIIGELEQRQSGLLFKNSALRTLRDVVLSRPSLWRLSQELIDQITSDVSSIDVEDEFSEPSVRSIKDDELRQSWACRRIDVGDELYERDALDTGLRALTDALSMCNLEDDEPATCKYYVPVSCTLFPNMKTSYDPMLTNQAVIRSRVERVASDDVNTAFVTSTDGGADDAASGDIRLQVSLRGTFVEGKPSHPLFFEIDKEGTLSAHVASHDVDMSALFTEDVSTALEKYTAPGTVSEFLRTINEHRVDTAAYDTCRHMRNARKTITFAIDRIYNILLFARQHRPREPPTTRVVIDLASMSVHRRLAEEEAQKNMRTTVYRSQSPFFNEEAARKSNARLVSIATIVAAAMLPQDIADEMRVELITRVDDGANIVRSSQRAMQAVCRALRTGRFSSIPLGELVACVVHEAC